MYSDDCIKRACLKNYKKEKAYAYRLFLSVAGTGFEPATPRV
ncbi:hypothetical protein CLOSCI_01215 [[Clostridium] scindens ATCC 35704]|nr:hypothetical protein CLOSCI_01215 [[Clostridium] scindens ATCC 35704]